MAMYSVFVCFIVTVGYLFPWALFCLVTHDVLIDKRICKFENNSSVCL